MKKSNYVRTCAAIAMALAVMQVSALPQVAAVEESGKKTVAAMSIDERRDIEHRVDQIANRMANSKSYFEDDALPIHIKSSFDPIAQSLVMAIDERFGPVSGFPEMEDMQSEIIYAVWPMLESIEGFRGFDWRYGGKDIYFWFPGDRQYPEVGARKKRSNDANPASVLISEGHGYYYHHGYKDWRFQRSPINGIVEDEITPNIAFQLWTWLTLDGVNAQTARAAPFFGIHEPSGKPLISMAARYLLERSLPDRPDIWHSLPDDETDVLREYKEDIRSRPLYANSLGVDAMISIHTNASNDPKVHGTRAFVQPNRADSEELASMVLCYMREHIHALKKYSDFPVARNPVASDKGENRLAKMPSVIVELGFHTNSNDAEALKDITFQTYAMRGVAKGYRLYRKGKGCEESALEVPETVQGFVGDITTIPFVLKGNPDFPMMVVANATSCGSDVSCQEGVAFLPEELEGKQSEIIRVCTDKDVARSPFSLSVFARDYASIETKPVQVMMSCFKRP